MKGRKRLGTQLGTIGTKVGTVGTHEAQSLEKKCRIWKENNAPVAQMDRAAVS